jgi:RNA polymerase sigma-70 factor (ECF subfamily)
VLRAQLGEREAFERLFEWNERLLRPHLRRILRDEAAVEDVLQEVFLTVYRKIYWLRDPELFRPWLFRIATREALRFRRRSVGRREDPLEAAISATSEEGRQTAALLTRQALRAMEDVSAASRAILSLHYLNDLSIEEAAALLGIPVGTAKSRLARGIQKLREVMGL